VQKEIEHQPPESKSLDVNDLVENSRVKKPMVANIHSELRRAIFNTPVGSTHRRSNNAAALRYYHYRTELAVGNHSQELRSAGTGSESRTLHRGCRGSIWSDGLSVTCSKQRRCLASER
jgi:hypothetical protein